ncbi:MAG: phosphotransferase family protein [Dehalococcoidia bacterium]
MHERTQAQAPWPFLIEKSSDVFGWSYAVMPLLPGVHLSDHQIQRSLTSDDRVGLAHAMGTYLTLIQQATWDVPGEYAHDRNNLVPLSTTFSEWFVARTTDWLVRCRKASDATTDADVAWVESVIAAALEALAVPFVPALVHTDYTEGNVVVERNGVGWKINGVFDLGEAYAGDGEYDLARLACWYGRMGDNTLRAFRDAYAAKRPTRAGFAERLALYILTDRLIFWEYGQRNDVWFTPGVSFRAWAEPFVEIAQSAALF